MKLTLEEVELAISECLKEMDDFENQMDRARLKKSPLADGYHKAFVQAGLRLNKLRQHRDLLEVQRYGSSSH